MSKASDFRIFGTSVPGGTVNPVLTAQAVAWIGEKLWFCGYQLRRPAKHCGLLARLHVRNRISAWSRASNIDAACAGFAARIIWNASPATARSLAAAATNRRHHASP
jgi:hypothetical protein